MIDCIELSPEETAFTLLLEDMFPQPMPPKKEVVMADTPIVRLKPLSDSDAKRLDAALKEAWPDEDFKPRGGLIMPPGSACIHDWQHCAIPAANTTNSGIFVKKCSKCHVLGLPPGD